MVKKICKIKFEIFYDNLYFWKHEHLFVLLHLYPAVCSTPARKKIIEQSKLCAGGTTAHPGYAGQ